MKLNSLHDLYVNDLRDLYDAESRLIKTLPKTVEAASSPELRQALEQHLEQSKVQVQRLEKIFGKLGESIKGQKCKGMEGIIEEGEDLMDKDAPPAVADAALISTTQRMEHYEIAGYGTLCNFARRLGFEDHAQLLHQTLEEERETDRKLTSLADSYINEEAKSAR
jgi:ferritin-like metal-binding protein YciE